MQNFFYNFLRFLTMSFISDGFYDRWCVLDVTEDQ